MRKVLPGANDVDMWTRNMCRREYRLYGRLWSVSNMNEQGLKGIYLSELGR